MATAEDAADRRCLVLSDCKPALQQIEAAMAAGELLEMLESLPRGAVEASVRLIGAVTTARASGQSPFSPALPRSAAARQAPSMSGQMDSARE